MNAMTISLSREFRAAVMEGEHPRLTFPRFTPVRRRPLVCPLAAGQAVRLSSKVSIEVLEVTKHLRDWVIRYEIFDERGFLLGRVSGYANSGAGSIQTTQAPAPGVPGEPFTGQFRPEREPEAIPRREASDFAIELRRESVDRLEEKRKLLAAVAIELKEMGVSDWGIQKQLDRIDERVLKLRATSGLAA
jgi:hypothetical protein